MEVKLLSYIIKMILFLKIKVPKDLILTILLLFKFLLFLSIIDLCHLTFSGLCLLAPPLSNLCCQYFLSLYFFSNSNTRNNNICSGNND